MKLLSVFLAFVFLAGCIEVRDKVQEEHPGVQIQNESQNLTVDEPMYVHRGRILSETAYRRALERPTKSNLPQKFSISFKQLTIKPGGIIYTMGHDVEFQIDDLFSDQGIIATYPEGQRAADSAGRSGGKLEFKVHTAAGQLLVEMRGEHGAHAKPADIAADGRTILRPSVKGELNKVSWPGERGKSGKDGLNGGNTGTLHFNSRFASRFSIQVKDIVGEGGDFSVGGEGGRFGGDGRRSPRGIDGKKGLPGIKEKMCIDLGNGEVCS